MKGIFSWGLLGKAFFFLRETQRKRLSLLPIPIVISECVNMKLLHSSCNYDGSYLRKKLINQEKHKKNEKKLRDVSSELLYNWSLLFKTNHLVNADLCKVTQLFIAFCNSIKILTIQGFCNKFLNIWMPRI